jgi:hypothetical protein
VLKVLNHLVFEAWDNLLELFPTREPAEFFTFVNDVFRALPIDLECFL